MAYEPRVAPHGQVLFPNRTGPPPKWVSVVDCREGLADMDKNSVSLVLTDPPYFIDGMGDEWDNAALNRRVKPGVVRGIPIRQKFDHRQGERLQAFLSPIAEQLMQVLRPGGFLLCFSQPRLTHRAATAIESAGFEVRDMIAWRHEGQGKAFTQEHVVRGMHIPEEEKNAIIERLGGRRTPQLRPQFELVVVAQKPREGTFVANWLEHGTGLIDVSDPVIQPHRFPGTLLPCPKPRDRHGHMTTKPVDLCRHLIRIFGGETSGSSVVLDPFTGSGTTGVAALSEGYRFLGFETDPHMATIANQRIERETQWAPRRAQGTLQYRA